MLAKILTGMLVVFLIKVLCAPFAFVGSAFAEITDIEEDADALYLMEAETGRVLHEYNGDKPWPPASLTKIMTLIIGLEGLEDGALQLDETTTVSTNAWETAGSQMYLDENQEVTIEDLLSGIAVVSANDASVALAEHMAGSVNRFVTKMNEKAKEIGLANTHFENPMGFYHPDQQITARDTAHLARYAVQNTPKILELESMPEFTFNNITQENRNKMLPILETSHSYPGTDGLKTGYISEAGYNFVGTSKQDDMRLIAVVLGSESEYKRFELTASLFDYGFSEYRKMDYLDPTTEIEKVEIKHGREKKLSAFPESSLSVVTRFSNPSELEKEFRTLENLEAPIEAGQKLGELIILEKGEAIARVDGIAQEDVEKAGIFTRIYRAVVGQVIDIFNSIKDFIVSLLP